MKLLLDTHVFIWWTSEPEKLSSKVIDLCEDSTNSLILSVASIWEIQIKLQLGEIKLYTPLRDLIESQQRINNVKILPIELEHVLALENLPDYHNDPFDRLLIAQANSENTFLVTKDSVFAEYPVKLIW
ncbi:type II toxin-antitoxin system VapC family toxin [bacterium]|nr:type II toxin-antitoxin system VapC family toxin [bacterium]